MSLADDPRLEKVAVADAVEGPITGGTYGIPYLAMPEGWEEQYGYTEEEYFLSGDAVAVSLAVRGAAHRRRGVGRPGHRCHGPVFDAHRRPPAGGPGRLQRHGRGRVAQRDRRPRLGPGLRLPGPGADGRGLRLRGRIGPEDGRGAGRAGPRHPRRPGGRAGPAEGLGPGALRLARPPRRRLLVRHLQPGGPHRDRARRRPAARRPRRPAPDRHRRIAVGVPPGHLRQRHPADHRHVRRLPDPQPRRRRRRRWPTSRSDPARRPPSSAPTSACRCSSSRPRPTSTSSSS